jgi:hypothetical protein
MPFVLWSLKRGRFLAIFFIRIAVLRGINILIQILELQGGKYESIDLWN